MNDEIKKYTTDSSSRNCGMMLDLFVEAGHQVRLALEQDHMINLAHDCAWSHTPALTYSPQFGLFFSQSKEVRAC